MTATPPSPKDALPALLTRRATAKLVGLSPRTIGRLSHRGTFPAPVQVPGLNGRRYRTSEVVAWVAQLGHSAHPSLVAPRPGGNVGPP